MLKKILFIFALALLIFPIVNATTTNNGPWKAGNCVNIIQVCTNSCTYLNITSIQYPNGSMALNGQYAMTLSGQQGNYSYCLANNTYGYYNINGQGDDGGTTSGWQFKVLVNASGQEVTQSQVILILIGLSVVFIFSLFFFVLSFLFNHPGPKIFFMALSTLVLVVLIGIVTFNAQVYLAEFPSLVSFYDSYFYLIATIAGTAMLGLIIWLIYYSFTLFNKLRGTDTKMYDD